MAVVFLLHQVSGVKRVGEALFYVVDCCVDARAEVTVAFDPGVLKGP